MKKTYLIPECKVFALPTSVLMQQPSGVDIDQTKTIDSQDKGGWSRSFDGFAWDDTED